MMKLFLLWFILLGVACGNTDNVWGVYPSKKTIVGCWLDRDNFFTMQIFPNGENSFVVRSRIFKSSEEQEKLPDSVLETDEDWFGKTTFKLFQKLSDGSLAKEPQYQGTYIFTNDELILNDLQGEILHHFERSILCK